MKPMPSSCLACAALVFSPARGFVSRISVVSTSKTQHSFSGGLGHKKKQNRDAFPPVLNQRQQVRHHQHQHQRTQVRRMVAAAPRTDQEKVGVGAGLPAPGTADMDWANLGFEYRNVNCHVKFTFKDGRWDEGETVTDPYVKVHIANTALHYGQSVFEGLKAFHSKDGRCVCSLY